MGPGGPRAAHTLIFSTTSTPRTYTLPLPAPHLLDPHLLTPHLLLASKYSTVIWA